MALRTRISGGLGVSALAITASAFALPTTALAQAADGGEIVVTGIRASLDASATIKRKTPTIVETVSAEDIGKLPDVSIAESIARLPGLAAQRVAGRAQIISVRGLAPDFTTVLLNGRQQASSGYNRAVEFDQYPSELLASVLVYKTPDAGLIGLRGGADPVQDESRIKLLLRQEPDAAHLYFALATLYVAQDRWAEAQQAYFDAFRRDAANPDYAFNLAISLAMEVTHTVLLVWPIAAAAWLFALAGRPAWGAPDAQAPGTRT